MQRLSFGFVAALAVGIAAALTGCVMEMELEPVHEEDLGEHEQELIGGVEVGDNIDTPAVFWNSGSKKCSGAKVGPRHVLTAAHCVTTASGRVHASLRRGRTITVTRDNRLDGTADFELMEIARTRVPWAWRSACLASLSCGEEGQATTAPYPPDVAVIVFRDDLPGSWTTGWIDTRRVTTRTLVTVLGYGCEDNAIDPTSPSPRRLKRYLMRPVPTRQVNVPNATIPTDELGDFGSRYILTRGKAYPGGAGASLCPGDSGGPLLRGSALSKRIVGINSQARFGNLNPGISRTNLHTRATDPTTEAWLEAVLPAGQVR